jgi:hypothetical protein
MARLTIEEHLRSLFLDYLDRHKAEGVTIPSVAEQIEVNVIRLKGFVGRRGSLSLNEGERLFHMLTGRYFVFGYSSCKKIL